MNRLAIWMDGHPRLLTSGVIALTVLALVGVSRVSTNSDPESIFRRDDQAFQQLERLYEDFGSDVNDVLVVVQGDDLFTPQALDALRTIVERAAANPDVDTVLSMFDARQIGSRLIPLLPRVTMTPERLTAARQEALEHPLVAGQFLSPDGKTTLVIVRLSHADRSVEYLEPVVARLREDARRAVQGTGLQVELAGHAMLRVETLVTLRRELVKFNALSVLFAGVIAWLLFHRWAAAVLTGVAPAVGVVWTLGLMGFTGQPINAMNLVVPGLVFIIGFASAVHILLDMRRSRSHGRSRRQAIRDAVRHLAPACMLTSLTTAVGFGSLMTAGAESVRHLGLLSAIGAGLSMVSVLTVLPLMARTRLGDWILPRTYAHDPDHPSQWLMGFVRPALEHPRIISVVSIIVCVLMLIPLWWLGTDIRWSEAIPSDSQTVQALRHVDRAFGGTLMAYVVIEWPKPLSPSSVEVIQTAAQVHQLFDEEPLTQGSMSTRNILRSLSGSTAQRFADMRTAPAALLERLERPELRRMIVSAHVPDVGAAAVKPTYDRLQRKLDRLEAEHPGFQLTLTGATVVAARNMHRIIDDLALSLTLASVVIFGMMTLAFRSVWLGVISVIPNAFPLLLTASILALSGQPLQITSVLTFNLCLGIAVDDTIHYLMRFRRERAAGADVRGAVRHSFEVVGTAMIISTLILLAGFAAMLPSAMPAIRLFAGLSCVAICAALVGDLLILPALLLTFLPDARGVDRSIYLSEEAAPASTSSGAGE